MQWLNYHHLLYFYVLAREGRLADAAKLLRLSPQTVLSQIRALEDHLSVKLFEKRGRKLVPSERGRQVYRLAEDIFALGQKVVRLCEGDSVDTMLPLRIGASDAVPKLLVRHVLTRLWAQYPSLRIQVREGTFTRLVSELAIGDHDCILTDGPAVPDPTNRRLHSHALGRSPLSFYAAPATARALQQAFPRSLAEIPLVLPMESSVMRRTLNAWFDRQGIEPFIVAETEDSALLKVLGSRPGNAFPAPRAIAPAIEEEFGAHILGDCRGLSVEYFFVHRDADLPHPAVASLIAMAPLREVFRKELRQRRSA